MAALSAAILGTAALGAGTGLYSAYQQAEAGKLESDFNAKQMEMNSRIAGMQADDAIDRGDKEANALKSKVGQVVGSQRAALASQGIDIDSGSADIVQADTEVIGERDVMTLKNNAWREAWGYKMEASSLTGSAAMERAAGENRYRNTLLTGGMSAVNTLAGGVKNSGLSFGGGGGAKTLKGTTTAGQSYSSSKGIA